MHPYVILQTTNHVIVFMFMFMKGENKPFDKVLGASQFTDPTLELEPWHNESFHGPNLMWMYYMDKFTMNFLYPIYKS